MLAMSGLVERKLLFTKVQMVAGASYSMLMTYSFMKRLSPENSLQNAPAGWKTDACNCNKYDCICSSVLPQRNARIGIAGQVVPQAIQKSHLFGIERQINCGEAVVKLGRTCSPDDG